MFLSNELCQHLTAIATVASRMFMYLRNDGACSEHQKDDTTNGGPAGRTRLQRAQSADECPATGDGDDFHSGTFSTQSVWRAVHLYSSLHIDDHTQKRMNMHELRNAH